MQKWKWKTREQIECCWSWNLQSNLNAHKCVKCILSSVHFASIHGCSRWCSVRNGTGKSNVFHFRYSPENYLHHKLINTSNRTSWQPSKYSGLSYSLKQIHSRVLLFHSCSAVHCEIGRLLEYIAIVAHRTIPSLCDILLMLLLQYCDVSTWKSSSVCSSNSMHWNGNVHQILHFPFPNIEFNTHAHIPITHICVHLTSMA